MKTESGQWVSASYKKNLYPCIVFTTLVTVKESADVKTGSGRVRVRAARHLNRTFKLKTEFIYLADLYVYIYIYKFIYLADLYVYIYVYV